MNELTQDLDYCTKIILDLKENLGKNIHQIGVYLNHVKDNRLYLSKYKFWGEYLENEVQFSERSAQRFMKLVKEYEPSVLTALGTSKCQILLALEPEERKEFIEEKGVKDITDKETIETLKEYKKDDYIFGRKNRAFKEKDIIEGVPLEEHEYYIKVWDKITLALKVVEEQIIPIIDGLEYRKHFDEWTKKSELIIKLETFKRKVKELKLP